MAADIEHASSSALQWVDLRGASSECDQYHLSSHVFIRRSRVLRRTQDGVAGRNGVIDGL